MFNIRKITIKPQPSFFKSEIYLDVSLPLTFPRPNHIAKYFEKNNIRLSLPEQNLLSNFAFNEMDARYSRRQFAVLTSLFVPMQTSQVNTGKSALLHILDNWKINPDQVESVEMSYLNSGNHKSAYKFDVFTSEISKAFVVGIDKNTGWFDELSGKIHSLLEFKFLSWVNKKEISLDTLPRLLGFNTFKGSIIGKKEHYCMIMKEFIDGQTADVFLEKASSSEKRERAVYKIGFKLAMFIARFGGFPNDFHYKNIFISNTADDKISVIFNDILGVVGNRNMAANFQFLPFLIEDVGGDFFPFVNGFADGGGGKIGMKLLNSYFSFIRSHPMFLMGNDFGLFNKFEIFKKEYKAKLELNSLFLPRRGIEPPWE